MATATQDSKSGHDIHSKPAEQQMGLPGDMPRPLKITMLGAGSGFTPKLLNDVLLIPGGKGGVVALVDIDTDRLATMHKVIEMLIASHGAKGWSVISSPDRTKVMADSDYIVNCIEVSGTACVEWDNDIPLKYGIDQCIGDTIGPGGLFKALRTVPVWLQMLKDAERLAPHALVLNYTNPMNVLCLAAGRTSCMPYVGLCHSVQHTSGQLASRVGLKVKQMQWECAGINHLSWFTQLRHNGQDLYPRLMKQAEIEVYGDPAQSDNANADDRGKDIVRKDMMLHFGAFITESSGHLSEYLPYYRKNKDAKALYCRDGYDGGSRFYASNWPTWRKNHDANRMAMVRGEKPVGGERTWEYASWIIEGREKDHPFRIHGNVMNNRKGAGQLITNLPADGCVEVACYVDRNGVNPSRYGALPAHMAAICASNMAMFDLAATACIERSKEAAIHALMLDPLTAAMCTPRQIRDMTLELFAAEAEYLPGYK